MESRSISRPSAAPSRVQRRGSRGVMSRKYFEFWPKGTAARSYRAGDEPVLQRDGCRGALPGQAVRDLLRGRADVRAVQGQQSRAARRIPAAGLRRAAGRSRAARDAEQPAVHRCVLRDPARQRDRRAGQPDERDRRARALRAGQRREGRTRRAGSLSAAQAAARREARSRRSSLLTATTSIRRRSCACPTS